MKLCEISDAGRLKLISRKVQSCETHQKEFSVSLEELNGLFSGEYCPYSGQEFRDWRSVTFERINPYLEYVSGNVLLVTNDANAHKSLLDNFVKTQVITKDMKIKLMRKALYQLEKRV